MKGTETIYDSNWSYIGKIDGLVYSGSANASFVISSNASVAATTANGTTIKGSNYAVSFPKGSEIIKHGINGVTSGKINSSSFTVNHGNGTTIKDCVETTYKSSDGDSGGIVLTTVNGDNVPTGIHNSTGGSYGYYCKVTNIVNALGVTPY